MKIIRHSIAAWLVSGLLLMSLGTSTLAGEQIRSGLIKELSSDYSVVKVGVNYYRMDKQTILHSPDDNSKLPLDRLTAGTRIGFHTEQPARGSILPTISEIWIYYD